VHTHNLYKHSFSLDFTLFDDLSYNARPDYDFYSFISKYLKKLNVPPVLGAAFVSFTIKEDGNISQPKLLVGVNPDFDKAIIDAISSCPKWIPASKKKKPVAESRTLVFQYKNSL
jgi:hypothetical protein